MPAKTHADRTKAETSPSALALLESARRGLKECENKPSAVSILLTCQLAVLRTAAAVLAAGSDPRTVPSIAGPQNIWDLLPGAAPALSPWATYFAVRPRPEHRGIWAWWHRAARRREADEFLRNAELFFALAADTLGAAEKLGLETPLPASTPRIPKR